MSPESSAEPGQWYTTRAEYLRGILDAFSDPNVEEVIVMSSSQVGKTETINNVVGYFIHQDPAPMLVVQPTVEMAETWSKDRLAPMLRDTPVLHKLVKDPWVRDSGNTLRVKEFPNGRISIAGANSAASLASRPVRIVLQDEIDRYPISAGPEGSPIKLAEKRAITFWNRKFGKFSTPTVKGISAIEREYDASDQRQYWVPCPTCAGTQVMHWGQLKWDKNKKGEPINVRYECELCGAAIQESDKLRMVRNGKWIPRFPERTRKAGFHINELSSPWSTWEYMTKNFLEAKKTPDTLKVFINTSLGQPWEEEGVTVDDGSLAARREQYGPELPTNVLVLTAGVDIQDDRIEMVVKGWGKGEETWLIEWLTFRGRTDTDVKVWADLDAALSRTHVHGTNTTMKIAAACIDSGHATKNVYDFCKKREHRRVWAVKGVAGPGAPVLRIPNRRLKKSGTLLGFVGVDTCKGLIYSRLLVEEFGPGYMHFPKSPNIDEEYFRQLTAEKLKTKFVRGFPTKVWEKIRARNEALDCEVYALAALSSLNVNMEKLAERMASRVEASTNVSPSPAVALSAPPSLPAALVTRPMVNPARRSGFVHRY